MRPKHRRTQLGITHGSTIGCVLDEHGQIRKLKFLDVDDDAAAAAEDPLAELDARFVRATRALRELLSDLHELLGRPG